MYDRYPRDANTMVEDQIADRDIVDAKVIAAMRKVPRHLFVPPKYRDAAYTDQPLPIGFNQTISQPYVVAFMTQVLGLGKDARVLEIGAGCGYQTAILAEIAREVFAVEIIADLAQKAQSNLTALGYTNFQLKVDDGRDGWPDRAPFSHILVAAASENIPSALIDQLASGGRMIIPVGHARWDQNLVLVTRKKNGIQKEKILPVRFVPLVSGPKRNKSSDRK